MLIFLAVGVVALTGKIHTLFNMFGTNLPLRQFFFCAFGTIRCVKKFGARLVQRDDCAENFAPFLVQMGTTGPNSSTKGQKAKQMEQNDKIWQKSN